MKDVLLLKQDKVTWHLKNGGFNLYQQWIRAVLPLLLAVHVQQVNVSNKLLILLCTKNVTVLCINLLLLRALLFRMGGHGQQVGNDNLFSVRMGGHRHGSRTYAQGTTDCFYCVQSNYCSCTTTFHHLQVESLDLFLVHFQSMGSILFKIYSFPPWINK